MFDKFYQYIKELFDDHVLSCIVYSFVFFIVLAYTLPSIGTIYVYMLKILPLYFLFWISLIFISTYLIYLFIEPYINTIDYILVYSLFAFIMLLVYSLRLEDFNRIVLLIIAFIIFGAIVLRFYLILKRKQDKKSGSVIDLKDIMEKKIDLLSFNGCIGLEESDVKYDLIDRGVIINQLYKTLFRFDTDNHYVVGLNGKWGSGKTTIINNVLRLADDLGDTKNFYINKFYPCAFDDDKKMLEFFMSSILKEMDISEIEIGNIVRKIIKLYFESKNSTLADIYESISQIIKFSTPGKNIKNIVSNHLFVNHKKLLVIIDDLDRIRIRSVVILISFLENIIQFDNTRVVLLYDKDVVDSSLKKEYSYKGDYLDKYINFHFDVPSISNNSLSLIKKRISENVLSNGLPILSFFNDELLVFDSIRYLKKYFNIVVSNELFMEKIIFPRDLAYLLYLLSENKLLYEDILKNKDFYIKFNDRDESIYYINRKEYDEERENYFDRIAKIPAYSKYIPILISLFPNIIGFFNGVNLNDDYSSNIEKESDSVRNHRIFHSEFFDLYFTYSHSNYLQVDKDALDFIELLNDDSFTSIKIANYLLNYDVNNIRLFCELLSIHVNNINRIHCHKLIMALKVAIPNISNEGSFFVTSTEDRLIYVLAELLIIYNPDINVIKNELFDFKKDIYFIYEIDNYYYHIYREGTDFTNMFHKYYIDSCNFIVDNEIDIMSKDYYVYKNSRALYRYNIDKEQDYLEHIVNVDNVLNILKDLIDVSISMSFEGVGYTIRKESIEKFAPFINFEYYLSQINRELTNNEAFVKNVYEKSINKTMNDEAAVIVNQRIDLRKE